MEETDSLQVVVVRGLLQVPPPPPPTPLTQVLVMALVLGRKSSHPIPTKDTKTLLMLALVAVTGGLRIVFIFTSFTRLPLGDSTTILFSSPVIVIFLSTFLLKEVCGVLRVVCSCSLVVGVVLITKPPLLLATSSASYDVVGYTLVLLACAMSALGVVVTKLLAATVDKPVILLHLGLATTACGAVGLVRRRGGSSPRWWWANPGSTCPPGSGDSPSSLGCWVSCSRSGPAL